MNSTHDKARHTGVPRKMKLFARTTFQQIECESGWTARATRSNGNAMKTVVICASKLDELLLRILSASAHVCAVCYTRRARTALQYKFMRFHGAKDTFISEWLNTREKSRNRLYEAFQEALEFEINLPSEVKLCKASEQTRVELPAGSFIHSDYADWSLAYLSALSLTLIEGKIRRSPNFNGWWGLTGGIEAVTLN